jgi:hypothetical protein
LPSTILQQTAHPDLSQAGLRIDRNEPAVYLSPVFQWYGKDFRAKFIADNGLSDKSPEDAAVLSFIREHISQKDSDWLVRKIYPVKYTRFNWALNEQR